MTTSPARLPAIGSRHQRYAAIGRCHCLRAAAAESNLPDRSIGSPQALLDERRRRGWTMGAVCDVRQAVAHGLQRRGCMVSACQRCHGGVARSGFWGMVSTGSASAIPERGSNCHSPRRAVLTRLVVSSPACDFVEAATALAEPVAHPSIVLVTVPSCRNTRPTTLALLVEAGADLTARDADGHTPLDIAKLNEKARVVEWIKKRIRAKGR